MSASPSNLPTYSDSAWPLFVATMPSTALSLEAFEAHLQMLREPYRRGQPFVQMIVMGDHPSLPAAHRRAAAEAMRLDSQRYPGLLRAKAIVAKSQLERGVVTAVGWIARPDYPFESFETEPEAKAWASKASKWGRARKTACTETLLDIQPHWKTDQIGPAKRARGRR
jgi:hypothetical protein